MFHFFSELLPHIFITLILKEFNVLYFPLWKKERFTTLKLLYYYQLKLNY